MFYERGRRELTHLRHKRYAWVSSKPFPRTQTMRQIRLVLFKPFTRTQTIREIRWCYSKHSLQAQTIRVGVIQTIHQDSNHTPNLAGVIQTIFVCFKPLGGLTRTIPTKILYHSVCRVVERRVSGKCDDTSPVRVDEVFNSMIHEKPYRNLNIEWVCVLVLN